MSWFTELGSDRIELLDGAFILLRDGMKVDELDASRVVAFPPVVVLTFPSACVNMALSWGEWTGIEGLPAPATSEEGSLPAPEEAKSNVVAETVVPKKGRRKS